VKAVEVVEAERAGEPADDDFSLLDRPFDAGEFYEDPPVTRWLRPAGIAALVVALGFGGYAIFHTRSGSRAAAKARIESPVVVVAAPPPQPVVVVPAAPVPAAAVVAAPAPAAAPAPTAAPAPAATPAPAAAPAPAVAALEPPSHALAGEQANVAAAKAVVSSGSADDPGPDVEPARPLSPRYPALVAEGERQFQAGRTKRAQALFEQALAETPEGTAALVGLGYVHLEKGKVPQAVTLFQRALVQDRDNATALFGLAESHRQAGNRSAALTEFQRFLTLRSSGSDADIAKQLVQQLASGG
jgi:hypothetical protein